MANSSIEMDPHETEGDETTLLDGGNTGYNSIRANVHHVGHGGIYNVSLILITSAVTIGFTFGLAAVLLPDSDKVEIAYAVVIILLSIFLFFLYVGFMMMYKNTDRTYLDITSSVGPTFGTGDMVDYVLVFLLLTLNVLSLVDCALAFTCNPSNITKVTNAVDIVLLISQFIFILFYIPRFLRGFNFEDKKVMYTFVTLATLQMCSWLAVAFAPLITLAQPFHNFPDNNSNLCSPINDTNVDNKCKMQTASIYFDSFHVEFAAVLTAFLFMSVNRVMYSTPDRALPSNQQRTCECNLNEDKRKLWAVILVSLLIAIGYLVNQSFAILKEFDEHKTGDNLVNGMQIPTFGFLVILAGRMIWDSDSGNTPLFMTEYIIIFTSLFDVFWYTLRDLSGLVCAILDETVRTPAIVSVSWTTLGICNTVTQTYLIVDIRRKKEKVPLWFRYALILFCFLNFAEWTTRIFIEGLAKESGNPVSPMVNALFGLYATQIISIIAFPIMNLYRLYFSLVTLELIFKKNLYQPNG
ncbi:uncharacterized protein [Amphiura filiformis]|uniref:uncharacterized protein n=1 Tax=Amphiura filiformis TaxID=82378 RepID=UPI003B22837A